MAQTFQIEGFECEALRGTSYNCPALKLYGLRDEIALKRSIRKELRKREKAEAKRKAALTPHPPVEF